MSSQCSPLVHQPFLPGLSSGKAAAHPGRAFPHPQLSGDSLTVVSGFRVRTRRREGAEGQRQEGALGRAGFVAQELLTWSVHTAINKGI